MIDLPRPVPAVQLACTSCQHVYEPDFDDFDTGNTGCPRCGGWTWIAQLGTAECSAVTSVDRRPAGQHVSDNTRPDPAVLPPRNPAGSGSPTTSE